MLSANAVLMNKVDCERADVLRAELAQLCWLMMHDGAGSGPAEGLLRARLTDARMRAARIPAGIAGPSITDASE